MKNQANKAGDRVLEAREAIEAMGLTSHELMRLFSHVINLHEEKIKQENEEFRRAWGSK